MALLVVVACGQEAADRPLSGLPAPVPRIEQAAQDVPVTGPLQVLDDTLLATHINGGQPVGFARSIDLGASWQPVEIPDTPDDPELWYDGLEIVDDVAVVAWSGTSSTAGAGNIDLGGSAASPQVWASRDGASWTGGPLPILGSVSISVPTVEVVDQRLIARVDTEISDQLRGVELFYSDDTGASWVAADAPDLAVGGMAPVDGIWRTVNGRLVAAFTDESLEDEAAVRVLESTDDGASWQARTCPEDAGVEPGRCQDSATSGGLRFGPDGVSADGGRRWHEPTVEPVPEAAEDGRPVFDGVAPLADGGWLALASFEVDQEMDYDTLVRSDDGVRWQQQLAADPCRDEDLFPRFSTPAPVGNGWLVVHSCVDSDPAGGSTPVWSDLYVTARDGTGLTDVPDSRRDGSERAYGQPVAVGDVVVLPVSDGESLDILHVRP